MKETGIIMSGNHPRLIFDGTKIMTRRTYGLDKVNKQPDEWEIEISNEGTWVFRNKSSGIRVFIKCPYGQAGDGLRVKETYLYDPVVKGGIVYKADNPEIPSIARWKPSMFMFKKDSRITLEITEVRVERLQEITEKDAIAEGTIKYPLKIRAGSTYKALEDYAYEAYPLKWGFSKGDRLQADVPSLGLARFYSLAKHDGQCIHLKPQEAFSLLEDEAMTYKEAFANLWDSLNAKRDYGWDTNPWVWVLSFRKV